MYAGSLYVGPAWSTVDALREQRRRDRVASRGAA